MKLYNQYLRAKNVKSLRTSFMITFNHTSLSSLPEIKWNMTNDATSAKLVISKFILETSKQEPLLHEFLMSNCCHLLYMDQQPSNIAADILDIESKDLEDKLLCPPTYSYKITAGLTNKAGCYAFFYNSTLYYIGSCINYSSRISAHYNDLFGKNTKFYNAVHNLGGFDKLTFVPTLTIPNRLSQYISINGHASLFATAMLRMITQYEIRIKEQALISHYKPVMNSLNVSFGFNESRLYVATKGGSVPVIVTFDDGRELNFASILQTKAYTGLSEATIARSANCTPDPSWCYSKELEQSVHFRIPLYPSINKRKSSTDFKVLNYDFNSLPVGKVFFLDKDLNLLNTSYKGGFKEVLSAIGVCFSKPGKYVNKQYLFDSPVLGQVYMVTNPLSLKANGFRLRALKAIDTLGLEPDLYFKSGKELIAHFNMKHPYNSYITKKMRVNKRYLVEYVD